MGFIKKIWSDSYNRLNQFKIHYKTRENGCIRMIQES
jgi:hypothetical protein